ncbi:MAG: hypothetical protein K8S55_00440 [Phycisphaerae bacterium]|nr:hypothetical protein [Phycisphaerae bacterium]
MYLRTIETKITVKHLVTTTPEILARLTTSLDDFEEIAASLAPLAGTGGTIDGRDQYAVAIDGEYAVLVNAEGYNYPRYRGPRMAVELLKTITQKAANAICVRKSTWPKNFTVETQEQLDDLSAAPYRIAE